MSKSVFIIHYYPLEFYPPIQNLINYLGQYHSDVYINILTTKSVSQNLNKFQAQNKNISISRFGTYKKNVPGIIRYFNYALFNCLNILYLIRHRPDKVMYFETISAFPVYVYKKYINKKASIFIHYHEYATQLEYSNGPLLIKYFHLLERRLYPIAEWVSHTNGDRLQKFINDLSPVYIRCPFILPNYPPMSWNFMQKKDFAMPYSIVYVGALSLETMYIKEFAYWVESQHGKVSWDIYSSQDAGSLNDFLAAIASKYIHFNGALDYYALPDKLKKYDIGVILYKGHIDNYIFNAPNKLFEYFACGLDIWFPIEMTGCFPYRTNNTFPKITPVDFRNLDGQLNEQVFSHAGCLFKKSTFYAEQVLPKLTAKMIPSKGNSVNTI